MQSSKRFLRIISEHFIATPKRLKTLSLIDPQRIYVENIRALLGTTTWVAKQICETAARQGVFVKRIQLLCPDGGAYTVEDPAKIPDTIPCRREIDGEIEEYLESTDRLNRLEFYSLSRKSA